MKPGAELPPRSHEVDASNIEVVSGILHDPNPIHLDPAAAAAAGLGDRVINQGPANLAYVLDLLGAAFPNHRIEDLQSRFLGTVRAGDRVEAAGRVISNEAGVICCETWLRVEDGSIALRAEVRLVPRS